ncbi:UNVERIFIED_CONTAM: hypothetical protein NCL1_36587 [Trichonephila clavipes]
MRFIYKDSSEGYIWIYRKKAENAQRVTRSVKKNCWFEESKNEFDISPCHLDKNRQIQSAPYTTLEPNFPKSR